MKWEKVRLADCCESIADGDHLPPPKAESGIPFVTISNIVNNKFDFTNTMFVPEEYYNNLTVKEKQNKEIFFIRLLAHLVFQYLLMMIFLLYFKGILPYYDQIVRYYLNICTIQC